MQKKIGEERKLKYGITATIADWKDEDNIVVQFSDGVRISTTYKRFLDNTVRVPIYKIIDKSRDNKTKQTSYVVASAMINGQIAEYKVYYTQKGKKNFRVGELHTVNNGQELKIIAYRDSDHIDVMFEDGTIVSNRKYGHIISGEVRNPNKK